MTNTYKYALHKMSLPGWSFYTNHKDQVYRVLDCWVCSDCKSAKGFTNDLEGLLQSDCGCEYWLEENITIKEVEVS